MAKLSVSETQDYLLKDGEPFFYFADTVWMAFSNLSISRWREYLSFRRAQGFNAVQISILPVANDTSISEENDDPFLKDAEGNWDFNRLNTAYFDKAEKMVEMAAAADFVPVLGVVWKCYVPGTSASRQSYTPTAMPMDAMKAYVQYAAARFGQFNPIFFISGDTAWDSDQEEPYYLAALEIVKTACPEALITMHIGTSRDIPAVFWDRLDFYMYQSGHRPEQKTPYVLAQKHAGCPVKRPVLNGEPCYEGHGKVPTKARFTAFDVRKAIWQSLLSGAKAGTAYGAHGVWSCHFEGMRFMHPDRKFEAYVWEDGLRLPGAWDAAFAKWLWERFDWFDLRPEDLLNGEDEAVRISVNADRSKIVLYTPCAYDLSLDVDLSGYRCEVIELESRRSWMPHVTTGMVSMVRMSMFNGDALFVAQK